MADGDDDPAPAAGETAAAADEGGDGGDAGGDAGGDDAGGDADAGGDDGGGDDAVDAADADAVAQDIVADGPADFDEGEIDDDVKAQRYAARMANKAGVKSRVKMYKICNMFEQAGGQLLSYALDNPMEKENALSRRGELLSALYYLRHISDIDDDFAIEEFESEMRNIKMFRSKMSRLAAKEDEFKASDDDDSSNDELDEADDMDTLKEARKLMEFAFGKDAKDK